MHDARRAFLFAACLLPLGAAPLLAADYPAEAEYVAPVETGWVFQVTPYAWAAGIKGDVSPFRRAPTVHIEKSFGDVLEDLNFGGFVNIWARNERFVFSGDVMYVNLSESKVIGRLPIVGPTPGLSADVDTAQFSATLQAGYRLYDAPNASFDLLGGARFWHLWNKVSVNYANRSVSVKSDFGWIDPVIGARALVRMNDKVSFLVQGDIGGFGAGSDFTWQALATVNYSFNDKFTASAGYKALSVDYEKNGHVFDTTLSGPVFGVTYRF